MPVGVTALPVRGWCVTVAVSVTEAPLVTVAAEAVSTVVVGSPKVILRIFLDPVSPTYNVPSAPTATPAGLSKLAAAPVPSVLPRVPEPATVVTTPAAVIFRILWEFLSATYTEPSAPTATPKGV